MKSYSKEVQKFVIERQNVQTLQVPSGTMCIGISTGGRWYTLPVERICYFTWDDVYRWGNEYIPHGMSDQPGLPPGPYIKFMLPDGTQYKGRPMVSLFVSARSVICQRDGIFSDATLQVLLEAAEIIIKLENEARTVKHPFPPAQKYDKYKTYTILKPNKVYNNAKVDEYQSFNKVYNNAKVDEYQSFTDTMKKYNDLIDSMDVKKLQSKMIKEYDKADYWSLWDNNARKKPKE